MPQKKVSPQEMQKLTELHSAKLVPFTFEESGITVLISKVSPLLSFELRRAFPEPLPPTQLIDYGDGRKVEEVNPSHPNYIQAMRLYNQEFEVKFRRLLVSQGVVYEMTDEDKARVKGLRDFWHETYEKELEGSDKMIFITMLAVQTPEDYEHLIEEIVSSNQATEEATKRALSQFPGPLS